MAQDIKGDKLWRTAALMMLCGLVYFFSYDHGRQALRPQLEALQKKAGLELENQRLEILRLRAALNECQTGGASARGPQPLDRVSLRTGHSEILFDGRLVLTLLRVENTENRILVQLNFLEEGRLVSEMLGAGGSLKFQMDGRNWALVVSALQLASANFSVIELKKEP
ncbi:MAG: hypothetical protein LBS31_07150 [Candidatus Adiutrix sp.]|jgi:hypothetical protein|nr:hypothetical protein [Candidatus Adiutrix sp.]